MDGAEWRQETECVTADVTEDAWVVILLQYFIQGCIDVAVTAALTECRWTGNDVFAWGEAVFS
jgi:hypothetical protein